MISFRNFALRRGERLLLSDVDLALHAGSRVGVVGRNGCGKSSLFAAIQGEIEPDRGDLDLTGLVCDRFWRVADGRVEAFDGDLDDYAAWLRSRGGKPAEPEPGANKSLVSVPTRRKEAAACRA